MFPTDQAPALYTILHTENTQHIRAATWLSPSVRSLASDDLDEGDYAAVGGDM